MSQTETVDFTPIEPAPSEPNYTQTLIRSLNLSPHLEGGYFVRTHCNAATLENGQPLSSSIYYLLTPAKPVGKFHRHASLTVHSLHSGRGRYVLIQADGSIETFVVGMDVENGERLQWVVPGGVWKASWAEGGGHLLISEVVVPAFSFANHEFLTRRQLSSLVDKHLAKRMDWLLKEEPEVLE